MPSVNFPVKSVIKHWYYWHTGRGWARWEYVRTEYPVVQDCNIPVRRDSQSTELREVRLLCKQRVDRVGVAYCIMIYDAIGLYIEKSCRMGITRLWGKN